MQAWPQLVEPGCCHQAAAQTHSLTIPKDSQIRETNGIQTQAAGDAARGGG